MSDFGYGGYNCQLNQFIVGFSFTGKLVVIQNVTCLFLSFSVLSANRGELLYQIISCYVTFLISDMLFEIFKMLSRCN